MYSIGEFSKIGSVSTKTLRYYDEINLLRPAYVDEDNHYRYYTEEQVDKILYIGELKAYDLRLEQIKVIMESDDTSLLEHFLKERVAQIDDQVRESMRLRNCIERKVQELMLGGSKMKQSMDLEVVLKKFEPVAVMSKTATIPMSEISSLIGGVYEEIFKNGMKPNGPVLTFYKNQDFNPDMANIEIAVPVDHVVEGVNGIKTIDPGECAMCRYQGAYSKLGKAYAAVMKWIGENGYQISSAPFDSYVSDPREVKDPDQLITEVWFPVVKC